jgi:hypothetical protein
MGMDTQNIDVFQLLKNLKDTNGTYPQELLAARRQGYLRQVAEVSGGAGLAAALKTTVKSTHAAGTGSLPSAGTLVESLLIVAIAAEASTVAYLYRDNFADLYQNITRSPQVVEVANPPVVVSPIPDFEFTPTPVFTEELTATSTETITPVGTPSVLAELPATNHRDDLGQGNDQGTATTNTLPGVVSTQRPDDGNDDNGNHYGLTPKPVRTIDSGNRNNNVNMQATPQPGNRGNR